MKGIALLDENFNIIEWNKIAELILGYSDTEVINKTIKDYIPLNINDITEYPKEYEIVTYKKNKLEVYLSVISSYTVFNEKKIYLVIFRDITNIKINELKIQRLNEALSLRIATLEQFNYMVAHDLNAPLRTLEGFSEILLQDYSSKLDVEGIDYIKRIITASNRMRNIIYDMMRLSRITTYDISISRQEINLTKLFTETNKHFIMDNSSRKYFVDIESNMFCVADEDLIKLVVENLLSNAWKFTSKKLVTLIKIGKFINDSGEATYFIKDNGAGFDQSKSDKLFRPFERLHTLEDFHGNGIGLTIVKRIIDLHNGKVWGEGVVGEGATFYFILGERI